MSERTEIRRRPRRAIKESPRLALDPAVRALQARINSQVARLSEPALRAVLPILGNVRRELASSLAEWLRKHPQDGADRWTAAKYQSLIQQCDEALSVARAIEPVMFKELVKASRTGGALATKHLEQQVAKMSQVFGQPILLDLETAAILAEGKAMLLPRFAAKAHGFAMEGRDAEGKMRPGLVKDIQGQLASGVAQGESWAQMTKRIASLGAPPGELAEATTAGMARGIWRRHYHRADRLVRTEVMNAYNVHHQISFEHALDEDAALLKRWDASYDVRCAICKALDHDSVPVKGAFEGPKGPLDHPPAHPYCRCTMVPWRKEWE